MNDAERMNLINQMGFTIGMFSQAAVRKDWPLARMHLNKALAGMGVLAMEIDEHDPVERES
jgi:hypothetical protein